jgi:methionyl-tRNA formyltransferase
MSDRDVVLLSKRDAWSGYAAQLTRIAFPAVRCFAGSRNDPFPLGSDDRPAILLSFLSPWIVPAAVLDRSDVALNFHPAPREYPGSGPYNFALYEGCEEYGAIVHHMAPRVDTGPIVEERRFSIDARQSVETLKLRTMVVLLAMFHDAITALAAGRTLPISGIAWSRRAFVRTELDALGTITPDMSGDEVVRRVRATTYPGFPGASVVLGGVTFSASVPNREPLA